MSDVAGMTCSSPRPGRRPGASRTLPADGVADLAGSRVPRAAAQQRADDDRGEHDGNQHDRVHGVARRQPPFAGFPHSGSAPTGSSSLSRVKIANMDVR